MATSEQCKEFIAGWFRDAGRSGPADAARWKRVWKRRAGDGWVRRFECEDESGEWRCLVGEDAGGALSMLVALDVENGRELAGVASQYRFSLASNQDGWWIVVALGVQWDDGLCDVELPHGPLRTALEGAGFHEMSEMFWGFRGTGEAREVLLGLGLTEDPALASL